MPANYREMPGFGVHTYTLISREGKVTYVKFHWVPQAGDLRGLHNPIVGARPKAPCVNHGVSRPCCLLLDDGKHNSRCLPIETPGYEL